MIVQGLFCSVEIWFEFLNVFKSKETRVLHSGAQAFRFHQLPLIQQFNFFGCDVFFVATFSQRVWVALTLSLGDQFKRWDNRVTLLDDLAFGLLIYVVRTSFHRCDELLVHQVFRCRGRTDLCESKLTFGLSDPLLYHRLHAITSEGLLENAPNRVPLVYKGDESFSQAFQFSFTFTWLTVLF